MDFGPEWRDFLENAVSEMFPMVEQSAMTMILMPEGDPSPEHAKLWVELGASVMLDKPLLLMALEGQELPPKLLGIADEIVRVDGWADREQAQERLARGLERMIERRGIGR